MLSKSTIKYIQSLQHKKLRQQDGVFVAEGPKVVSEILASGLFEVKNIYASSQWLTSLKNEVRNLHEKKTETVEEYELQKMSSYVTANSVLAVFKKMDAKANPDLHNKVTLMLDDIRDPGNFGTIIRTADWFGIENIICSPETVDMYNPKVVQSTMASIGRVNIYYSSLAEWLKSNKPVNVLAATLNGKPLHEYGQVKEAIIIIGNEANGIHHDILKFATGLITIPGFGAAESLNAAVATGIILSKLIS